MTIADSGAASPAGIYLWIYLSTLVLHLVFVHYCFAGAFVLAGAAIRGRLAGDRIAQVVREWLPAAVSCAITAGIAPLLFVQILYQRSFYTANLLLFNRWMALLPVLIVACYALYIVKAKHLGATRGARRMVVAAAVLAAGLLVYVAWAFVENHLVGLRPDAWSELYRSNSASLVGSPAAWARLAMWVFSAFPVFAVLMGWQLRLGAGGADDVARDAAARRLSALALLGLLGAIGTTALYGCAQPEFRLAAQRAPIASLTAVAGQCVTVVAWSLAWRGRKLPVGLLASASAGALLSMSGMAFIRELMRIDMLAGTEAAIRSAQPSGGSVAFLVFALLGILTICWIVRSVARSLSPASPARPTP